MNKQDYYNPKEMMEYLRDKALDAIGQIVYGDLYTIPTEEKVPRIEGIFDLLISVAEDVDKDKEDGLPDTGDVKYNTYV